jgi:hypothetical protein
MANTIELSISATIKIMKTLKNLGFLKTELLKH